MKYTLWKIEHIDAYNVDAIKQADTSSEKELEKWLDQSWYNAASSIRKDIEIGEAVNANYINFFQNN